jgi:hypothetical protein
VRLVDLTDLAVGRGFVVRFPGDFPGSSYEAVVDYLLVLRFDNSFEFVVATGYKAGHVAAVLPAESVFAGTHMLSVRWLVDNWTHIRPEVPVEQVECIANYPAPLTPRF